MSDKKDDIQTDYDFAREQYQDLVKKGNDAIDLMMELVKDSESPRAFEVLSSMMKQNAEIADKLMTLQKDKKVIEKMGNDLPALLDAPVTNNNLFVGDTAALQQMLQGKFDASLVPEVKSSDKK
tara:strand:- start:397 stop:768 length:372 start_codon:yes stop_codon:yes gene_type:complete